MSVLLDALKKAAEEKRKADEANVDDASSEELTSASNNATTESSLNEGSTETRPKTPDLGLKLNSNAETQIQPEQTDNLAQVNESSQTELPDNDNESLSETDQVEDGEQVVRDDRADISFKLNLQSNQSTPSKESTSSLLTALDSDEELPVFDVNEVHDAQSKLATKQTSNSEAETSSNDNQNSESVDVTRQPSVENVITDMGSSQTTASKPTEVKDTSDDWRMDELPGYQESATYKNMDDTPPLESNSILMKSANTGVKKKKTRTSFVMMMSMFVVLAFLVIGLYALLYYQEKNSDLESSMKKYELTKMEFKEKSVEKNDDKVIDGEQSSLKPDSEAAVNKAVKEVQAPTENKGESAALAALGENQSKVENAETQLRNDDIEQSANTQVVSERSNRLPTTATSKASAGSDQVKSSAGHKVPVSKRAVEKNRMIAAKKSQPSMQQQNLSLAYSAYEQGNFAAASWGFNQVLAENPNNINAMLGLAAIEVTKGNSTNAIKKYQQVLEKAPNNKYAYEALATLSSSVKIDAQWLDDLKLMADKYPNSAVIQFALGNAYAQQQDWLNAQSHYFNAYVFQPNNPDYVMNLAVSFDRLGKYDLANRHYIDALGLTETTPANFDEQAVRNRLISIRQLMLKGH